MPSLYRSLDAVQLSNSWLTIGVYDGVHLGHQEILQKLTAGAHATGAPAVVLTFSPHPASVLSGREIPCLTTSAERAELLFQQGIDVVIDLEFTRELSNQTAEDFMALLKRQLGLVTLISGYDFALGRNRAGNLELLTLLGQELDYSVQVVQPVRQAADLVISSTIIRQAIADGEVREAAARLGRPYAMSGQVIPGDGRGRTIGIPTANVDIPRCKAIPRNGVYACWASVDGQRQRAVVNIGLRPTFTTGEVQPRIEAHLLDYSSDLYGQVLTLELVERLRDEQKFASIDALITQIRADIERGRTLL